MKICPHCKKEIPDRAIKCKYCYRFLDNEEIEKENTKVEKENINTKPKKKLSTAEATELKELEELYNKNTASFISNITGYLGCGLYILLFVGMICMYIWGNKTDWIRFFVCVIALIFELCIIIIIYKKTNNYIKYTGINVFGGAASYWIPIVHYISSPKLIEQILKHFSDDKRFSGYLSEQNLKVNRRVNILYSIPFIFLLFSIIVGIMRFDENSLKLSEFFTILMGIFFSFVYYNGYYDRKLDEINTCISKRIRELKGEEEDEDSGD